MPSVWVSLSGLWGRSDHLCPEMEGTAWWKQHQKGDVEGGTACMIIVVVWNSVTAGSVVTVISFLGFLLPL